MVREAVDAVLARGIGIPSGIRVVHAGARGASGPRLRGVPVLESPGRVRQAHGGCSRLHPGDLGRLGGEFRRRRLRPAIGRVRRRGLAVPASVGDRCGFRQGSAMDALVWRLSGAQRAEQGLGGSDHRYSRGNSSAVRTPAAGAGFVGAAHLGAVPSGELAVVRRLPSGKRQPLRRGVLGSTSRGPVLQRVAPAPAAGLVLPPRAAGVRVAVDAAALRLARGVALERAAAAVPDRVDDSPGRFLFLVDQQAAAVYPAGAPGTVDFAGSRVAQAAEEGLPRGRGLLADPDSAGGSRSSKGSSGRHHAGRLRNSRQERSWRASARARSWAD